MKDGSLYFLGQMLDQLFESILSYKEEYSQNAHGKGILTGYYIVIGKLFHAANAMGLSAALPPSWQDAASTTLANDIEQGKYTFNHVLQLSNTFMRASEQLPHRPLNLQRVLEEIISESNELKKDLKSEYDLGILHGYYFCFNKLFNNAGVWELLETMPAALQNFVPEAIVNNAVHNWRRTK